MTQSLIRARHERMFGNGRHRKRRLRKSDDIWLALIDRLTMLLDETEHDLRAMTQDYPPHILNGYLADAAEIRSEFESWRREILTDPRP
jgi:hypothetical protein